MNNLMEKIFQFRETVLEVWCQKKISEVEKLYKKFDDGKSFPSWKSSIKNLTSIKNFPRWKSCKYEKY